MHPKLISSNLISEQEKRRRLEEIKLRQHRLMSEMNEAQQTAPAHIDHIMKSGFTMSDLKGMRNFGDDAAEADEILRSNPQRPPRKGSLTQNGYETMDSNSRMHRSVSAINVDPYQSQESTLEDKDKKRGRSPFKFFKKSRDASKESKFKSKSKSPDSRRSTPSLFCDSKNISQRVFFRSF